METGKIIYSHETTQAVGRMANVALFDPRVFHTAVLCCVVILLILGSKRRKDAEVFTELFIVLAGLALVKGLFFLGLLVFQPVGTTISFGGISALAYLAITALDFLLVVVGKRFSTLGSKYESALGLFILVIFFFILMSAFTALYTTDGILGILLGIWPLTILILSSSLVSRIFYAIGLVFAKFIIPFKLVERADGLYYTDMPKSGSGCTEDCNNIVEPAVTVSATTPIGKHPPVEEKVLLI